MDAFIEAIEMDYADYRLYKMADGELDWPQWLAMTRERQFILTEDLP